MSQRLQKYPYWTSYLISLQKSKSLDVYAAVIDEASEMSSSRMRKYFGTLHT